MKHLLFILTLLAVVPVCSSCDDDDDKGINYIDYYPWRDRNNEFMTRLETNLLEYGQQAYFHDSVASLGEPYASPTFYHVCRAANEDSLRAINKWYTPYFTSTLKVHYTLYDTESVLDKMPSGAGFNDPAVMDSIFFDSANKADTLQSMQVEFFEDFTCRDVVKGWADVLQQMHIGDMWVVAIPWQTGYGQEGQMAGGIDPYSTLFFRIELCDITWWGGTVDE